MPDWAQAMMVRASEGLNSVETQYGVDPLVFGVLWVVFHVGLFYVSLGAAAWCYKRGRGMTSWLATAAFFYFLPYFYIMLFGRNLPLWVWTLVAALVVASFFVMRAKLRARLARAEQEVEHSRPADG